MPAPDLDVWAMLRHALFPEDNNNQEQKWALGTRNEYLQAGEDQTNDVIKTQNQLSYLSMSASGVVKNAPGQILGLFVATASGSPTLKVWDSTAASGSAILDTFIPAVATFYNLPGNVKAATGIYVSIGGTLNVDVFYF